MTNENLEVNGCGGFEVMVIVAFAYSGSGKPLKTSAKKNGAPVKI
jgi:hypothetical protein